MIKGSDKVFDGGDDASIVISRTLHRCRQLLKRDLAITICIHHLQQLPCLWRGIFSIEDEMERWGVGWGLLSFVVYFSSITMKKE